MEAESKLDPERLLALMRAMDRIASERPPKTTRFLGVPTVGVIMDAPYLARLGELADEEYEAIRKAKS